MQFLETIEGKSGEELASAVLKFLLVNSSNMRSRFVQHLRNQLPASKTPTFRDGIICQCEFPTKDGDADGSIDILIREESRMVLAVENKFWAAFTDDQPRKYLPTLRSLVRDESACRIVLLFPESRKPEIIAHVTAQGVRDLCLLVYWEDVQGDLDAIRSCESTEIAAAASFLREYVSKQVLETNLGIESAHLLGPHVQIGNDFQCDFLYKMKTIFPSPERLCPATNWFGFHFRLVPEKVGENGRQINKQWFGFVKTKGEVILGLSTGLKGCGVQVPQPLESVDNVFHETTFLKVNLDGKPKTTPEWKVWLEPVFSQLRSQLLGKQSPEASPPSCTEKPQ